MRRFGFTIVELLVVLAIIALIMSLLVPSLGTARLQTKTLVCSSNIKQILALLIIYEQQNGNFPYGFVDATASKYAGDPLGDKQGKWWFQYITHTTDANEGILNGSIFWCPSRCIIDPTSKHNILCGNYGVNRAICKDKQGSSGTYVGIPLGMARIPHPQDTLLVVDSGYSLISWQGAANANVPPCESTLRVGAFYLPGISANMKRISASPVYISTAAKKRIIDYSISELSRNDAINGRHRQKTVNAGYVDGHTTTLKAEELSVLEENGIYKNIQTWVPK